MSGKTESDLVRRLRVEKGWEGKDRFFACDVTGYHQGGISVGGRGGYAFDPSSQEIIEVCRCTEVGA